MTEPSLREESIFAQALEIPSAAELAAFLDRACGDDPALRAGVEALLRADAKAGDLLDLPEAPPVTVDLPAAEAPGTVIGPYKLIEQIGEGGMGAVWMAQQIEPVKRLVAVKLIKAGMDSKQVIARFDAERQALALMDHPNIAKVLDAGTTDAGRPYFVMDLVKGVPITKYCDEHRLTPRQRLELFVPVCRAVQHAHQKGVIHRDLKPTNVLVALYDGEPVPKVIDFGVAKAAGQPLTDKTLVTGFGAVVGTVEYMSPEQASFNQLDVDTRSDIYSLGVLLYELLAGSAPFGRKELETVGLLETLRIIREQEPTRPSTKLSTAEGLATLAANRGTEPAKLTRLVRGELDWIAMKALEKDRNRRYETANGFAADVQRYLADEPVLACPPTVGYRLRKLVRRHRGLAATLAGAGVLVLVAGLFAWRAHWLEGQRRLEQQQYLAERREAAIDRALAAAMGGEFEAAEEATREAERLGAPPGWVRMLHGQIALHRGELREAIKDLRQAVELLPDSVAARAMLVWAHIASGGGEGVIDEDVEALQRLRPVTAEDYLFKGQVESLRDPARALRTLDEAVARRRSGVALLIRSWIRVRLAEDTGNLADAEGAVDDAAAARALLGDSPYALAISVTAHNQAAFAYRQEGRTAKAEEHLARGGQFAEALAPYRDRDVGAVRGLHYALKGDDEAALAEWRRGSQRGNANELSFYITGLYRRGEFKEALAACDSVIGKGPGGVVEVERIYVLAELDPEGARKAYEQLTRRPRKGKFPFYPTMVYPTAARLLGDNAGADRLSRELRDAIDRHPKEAWGRALLDYNCGLLTDDQFLSAAGPSRVSQCEGHTHIALRRLAAGDRAAAREHFRKSADSHPYAPWCRAFLVRLEQDPAWPRWIR